MRARTRARQPEAPRPCRAVSKATGLGRSTIHNTFAGKHDLFGRALRRYARTRTAAQAAVLEDESIPPLKRVQGLLGLIVADERDHRRGERGIGCLGMNSTLELADRDPEVASMLDADLRRRLEILQSVIALGQRDGTVAGGMRIAGTGGADCAELEGIAATAMEAWTA